MIHSQEVLDKCTGELISLYQDRRCTLYPNFTPKKDAATIAQWRALAQFILDSGVQPRHYITAYFKMFSKLTPFPNESTVSHLRQSVVDGAKELLKLEDEEAKTMTKMMFDYLDSVTERLSLTKVLLDETNYLNPLFRYTVAYNSGRLETAKKYRERAKDFLLHFPVYRNYLDVPKELLTECFNK